MRKEGGYGGGVGIIALSVAILVASPLVKWIAWAGLVYGLYTLVKEQT